MSWFDETLDEPAHLVEERESATAARSRLNGQDLTEREAGAGETRSALEIESYGEVRARLAAAPHPGWLAQPIWPADAHGVIGAEDKAGKTWMVLDLAVAKATGGSWLGLWATTGPGRVLAFLGEGGARKMTRRIEAVRGHHQADAELLGRNLRLCFRAPSLVAVDHLAAVEAELARHQPKLVIIDPLYLAARGADGASLYQMGTHLEAIQNLTQRHGAALAVVTHWNQTGTGKGRGRFTGAGPAEWGRVTMSVAVDKRSRRGAATIVSLQAELVGDEIPDTSLRFARTVWADDPDDLASPLHYEITHDRAPDQTDTPTWSGPTECVDALLVWWTDQPTGTEQSASATYRDFKAHQTAMGRPCYREATVRDALALLAAQSRLRARPGPRNSTIYRLPHPRPGDLFDTNP